MQIASPQLYGLSSAHLVEHCGFLLEKHTARAFKKMRLAAAADGITIDICSAFRDFDKQQLIWNAKACGKRALLDKDSQAVDVNNLTASEVVAHILLWSALPGTSRHHWGTDIDIFDSNMISKQQLQLVPQEYESGGPCHALHHWLLNNAQRFGFYFPFQQGLSGVSAEPWHLSYFPVAQELVAKFAATELRQILQASSVCHKETLLDNLDELIKEYVFRVAPIPL